MKKSPTSTPEALESGFSYFLVSENEIDMVPQRSLWVTVGNISIYIGYHDKGVSVDLYPVGREDESSLLGNWLMFDEVLQEEK